MNCFFSVFVYIFLILPVQTPFAGVRLTPPQSTTQSYFLSIYNLWYYPSFPNFYHPAIYG